LRCWWVNIPFLFSISLENFDFFYHAIQEKEKDISKVLNRCVFMHRSFRDDRRRWHTIRISLQFDNIFLIFFLDEQLVNIWNYLIYTCVCVKQDSEQQQQQQSCLFLTNVFKQKPISFLFVCMSSRLTLTHWIHQ
jgi:hypothetical protein